MFLFKKQIKITNYHLFRKGGDKKSASNYDKPKNKDGIEGKDSRQVGV